VLEGILTGDDRVLDNRGRIGGMVIDGVRATAVAADDPPPKPRWRYEPVATIASVVEVRQRPALANRSERA
jgi:hypothetical protein